MALIEAGEKDLDYWIIVPTELGECFSIRSLIDQSHLPNSSPIPRLDQLSNFHA